MSENRFKERRRRLMEQIGSGIVLMDASGRAPDPVLADRNLHYLTGYAGRNAYLLLAPKGIIVEQLETLGGPELNRGRRVYEILFIHERTKREIFMDGESPTFDDLLESTGVDRVYDISLLDFVLPRALIDNDLLWVNVPGGQALDQQLSPYLTYIQTIRDRNPWLQVRNVAYLVHQLRFVKDDLEIAALREAFAIQTQVYEEIMRTLKPGVNESVGEAILDRTVGMCGVRYGRLSDEEYAASIIVGSGANSAIPHYMDNSRTIQDGDLVLIDSGISVDGYYADITRTFPANGHFTPRQRELYAVVLEAEKAAIATMVPGSNLLAANQAVYDVFKKYGVAEMGYGNNAHPVGLSIHDPYGRQVDDRDYPFSPGCVLVIEPFLMFPGEMGIRIEDGLLITETGNELLAAPPKEIDEVEALCQQSP